MFGWFKKTFGAQKAKGPEPIQISQLQFGLAKMMQNHGLNIEIEDDWVFVVGHSPRLRATGRQPNHNKTSVSRQIDIELRLNDDISITEQYGGFGANVDEANANVLYRFCCGTFHVFLSAFWDHHEPDQVETEDHTINGSRWCRYTGNAILMSNTGQTHALAPGYDAAIVQALQPMPLSGDYHWVSTFVSSVNGDLTVETYLDNGHWHALDDRIRDLDWPSANGFYSCRNFVLLKRLSD